MNVNFKKFSEVLEFAKIHNLQLPTARMQIKIADADKKFRYFFEQILAMKGVQYKHCPEYDEVIDWLTDNKQKGLFLYGDCGRGKSIIVRYLLPLLLLNESRKIIKPMDMTSINTQERLREVMSEKIITLDDIGTEEPFVDFTRHDAFPEIIDAVEKFDKLLIITSNLDDKGIEKRYGYRVLERIFSTTRRVKFSGKSFRK